MESILLGDDYRKIPNKLNPVIRWTVASDKMILLHVSTVSINEEEEEKEEEQENENKTHVLL